ncbi:MAG: aspartate-semialdehyde dehydrogenase [Waddliaceae bacterium]
MNSKHIPVGILGATGLVGRKFVELLSDHPWFKIASLAASKRSVGKRYGELVPHSPYSEMRISPCEPELPCRLVFSALDSTIAGDIEQAFARSGYIVISNSSTHRLKEHVPLLVPEVNAEQLQWVRRQNFPGMIVTNPNCIVISMAMALKPLIDRWGIEKVHVVTLQAKSGAGFKGLTDEKMVDNVIPHIANEREKIETEPLKIFGDQTINISAQCNRIPVVDGHTVCISIQLKKKATRSGLIEAWRHFRGGSQISQLPTAPKQPIYYWEEEGCPQPRLHRNLEGGMSISIGGLEPCSILDWKCVIHSHNLIRGGAGCAVLNAELAVHEGFLN